MIKVYFTDNFEISPEILEEYGALNISLINDLPLFIDPFLLFTSENSTYHKLHDEIINYLRFLRDKSSMGTLSDGLLKAWFMFGEVKQTWLGFSKSGNRGTALGWDFAKALNKNLQKLFIDFGEEKVTNGSHLEKLCLIQDGVGRDNISDFTTNLIKEFLLSYTQTFSLEYISPDKRKLVNVGKTRFNYETETWEPKSYELPYTGSDYVLLTPKDILTKDDVWINKNDLIEDYEEIADSIPGDQLRAQVNNYFLKQLDPEKKPTKEEYREAVNNVLLNFPQVIEHYIRFKEDHGKEAESLSEQNVAESEVFFIKQAKAFVSTLFESTNFYRVTGDTLSEASDRVKFLKDVIENKGGHRIFFVDGNPVRRESDLHVLFRLTWHATISDVSREVNDGRGPVDFKISRGVKDKTLVEFKLASNSQLRRNLENQVKIYAKASDAPNALKVIVYFSENELKRVQTILLDLNLVSDESIVLIDARADNKPSGSKA